MVDADEKIERDVADLFDRLEPARFGIPYERLAGQRGLRRGRRRSELLQRPGDALQHRLQVGL